MERRFVDGRIEGTIGRVYVEPKDQRCVGFLDDTCLQTNRPSPNYDEDGVPDNSPQRSVYTGFMKKHGLKAQTVYFPDGMVGSVFVASMRNNDNGMMNLSALGDLLNDAFPVMDDCETGLAVKYALFCDGIFHNHECLFNKPHICHDEYEEMLFIHMNSMQVLIENMYARFKTLFPIFSMGKRNSIDRDGNIVRMIVSSFFLLNCHTCFNGTNSTIIFDIAPPTIDEYLPDGEVLEPAPVVDVVNVVEE